MPRARPALPAEALANAALDHALKLRRGERLRIDTWNHALPWARALVVGALRRRAVPTLVLRDEEAYFAALAGLGVAGVTAALGRERSEADAVVHLDGPEGFPRLLGLPPADLDRLRGAHRRSLAGPRARTLRLRIADVTPTAAERFGVDPERWEAEVVRACRVEPARLAAAGARWSRRFRPGRRLRIRHPNGTDLSLVLARRPGWLDTGVAVRGAYAELPSGRWVAPIASRSAEGEFETNRASYDRYAADPVAVRGRIEFGEGRVRGFEEDRASQALAAFARTGKGRVRAFAIRIGLNPEVTNAPEIADLADGTVTLVVADPVSPWARHAPHFVLLASLAGATVTVERHGTPRART